MAMPNTDNSSREQLVAFAQSLTDWLLKQEGQKIRFCMEQGAKDATKPGDSWAATLEPTNGYRLTITVNDAVGCDHWGAV